MTAAGRTSRWTTPRRLRAYLAVIVLLAIALLVAGEAALGATRRAVHVMADDAGPRILAALEIQAALADVDAAAASTLLARGDVDVATQVFELRRGHATRSIVDASAGVSGKLAQKTALLLVLDGITRYVSAFADVRVRLAANDPSWKGAYRALSDMLQRRVLPSAADLDRVSADEMDAAYRAQRTTTIASEVLALFIGGALVIVLLSAQIFLVRRTRRVFNLPLLGATVLSLVMTILLVARFEGARADLRVAKDDAFASIHTLMQIRAVARGAHADVLRAQLDRERATQSMVAFNEKVSKLSSSPEATVSTQLRGLFADAFANITFDAERPALDAMVSAYARYHANALLLDRATDPAAAAGLRNTAEAAFDDFDSSALRALHVNKEVYTAVLSDSDRGLKQAEIVDPLVALLVALLAWLGIRPRLKEYA